MSANLSSAMMPVNAQAELGIVTVTYNSAEVLGPFLDSVSCQSYKDFVLYAVDNQSTDSTLATLREWPDERLRIIANGTNLGIAEGNNQGALAALADGCNFILFLNNDIEFQPDTFRLLIEELKSLGADLLGPKIYYEDGIHVWSAGGGFSVLKGYLGFHIGEGEIDRGQFEAAKAVQHTPACCLLVRREVFDVIGFMDPKYFVYQDDTDFCYRAWKAGLKMFYSPLASILHKVSSLTGGAKSAFTMRYNARGHVYFMLKNLGVIPCLFYLPAWELRLLFKFVSSSISGEEFLIRQRGGMEGLRLWMFG